MLSWLKFCCDDLLGPTERLPSRPRLGESTLVRFNALTALTAVLDMFLKKVPPPDWLCALLSLLPYIRFL